MIFFQRILFFSFLFAGAAFAGQVGLPNDSVSTTLQDQSLKVSVISGFHFNENAPNHMLVAGARLKPSSISKQELVFSPVPHGLKDARATVYVCDDAMTFCEPRTLTLGAGGRVEPKTKSSVEPAGPTKKPKAKNNAQGFIEDDFDAAKMTAKRDKKLILADFAANWCPACLRLENEIFPGGAFRTASAGFVKVRFDADRIENSFVKKQFGIRGIPSLIAMNAEGEEISRIVDYQPPEVISRFLKSAELNPQTFAVLKKKADQGDANAGAILAERFFDAGRYEESLPYLRTIVPPSSKVSEATIQAEKKRFETDPSRKSQLQTVLREAIHAEPQSARALRWRATLLSLLEDKAEEKRKVYDEGVKRVEELLADKEKMKTALVNEDVGEYADFEPLLIATYGLDLADDGKMGEAEVNKAWQRVADVGSRLKIPPSRTGPAYRYLGILVGAKKLIEAESLARGLLKHHPETFQVQRSLSRILNQQSRFSEAAKLAEASLKNSFGRNEFWAAEQLAKAYIGEKKLDLARTLVEKYLHREELNWPDLKGERKHFEDLRASLSAVR